MPNLLERKQVGNGLEVITGGMLQVKAADSTIEVSSEGVKAVIPEQKRAVANVARNGNAITLTFTDSTTASFDLPEVPVDVHLEGVTFQNGKLVVTLNNGTTKETEFTSAFLRAAFESMSDTEKGKIADSILPTILAKIKGEIVQDFADKTLGYLLKA